MEGDIRVLPIIALSLVFALSSGLTLQAVDAPSFLVVEDAESVETPSGDAGQGTEDGANDTPESERVALEDGEAVDETNTPEADPEQPVEDTPESQRVVLEDGEASDEAETPESGDDHGETSDAPETDAAA